MALSRRARRILQACWLVLIAGMFMSRCLTSWAPSLAGYETLAEQWVADASDQDRVTGSLVRGRLRLATWNLQWLNQPNLGPHPRSEAQLEAMRKFAGELPLDVIAVQEVASLSALRRVFPAGEFDAHLTRAGGAQKVGFVLRRGIAWRARPDVTALGQDHLRPAADIEVLAASGGLRLLAVHLKAGCTTRDLGRSPSCQKLARQLPPVEGWIDARARAGEAFAVVGDFNRYLLEDGPLWRAWDDGDPSALRLRAPTAGLPNGCRTRGHSSFIDHVVLGGPAVDWWIEGSLRVADHGSPTVLGDHCPVGIDLAVGP